MPNTSQVIMKLNLHKARVINLIFYTQKGGGNIKIESKKLDFKAGSRIEAKNEAYTPRGGDKKVKCP